MRPQKASQLEAMQLEAERVAERAKEAAAKKRREILKEKLRSQQAVEERIRSQQAQVSEAKSPRSPSPKRAWGAGSGRPTSPNRKASG